MTWNFPYHKARIIRPDDPGVQFGGGYQFSSKSAFTKQREIICEFNAMIFYMNSNGTKNTSATETSTYDPQLNWWLLEQLYINNGTWNKFDYVYAPDNVTLKVRFKGKLEQPKTLPGGQGVSEPFEITLIEQP